MPATQSTGSAVSSCQTRRAALQGPASSVANRGESGQVTGQRVAVGPGMERDERGRFSHAVADRRGWSHSQVRQDLGGEAARRPLARESAPGDRQTPLAGRHSTRDPARTGSASIPGAVLRTADFRPEGRQLTAHAGEDIPQSGVDEGDAGRRAEGRPGRNDLRSASAHRGSVDIATLRERPDNFSSPRRSEETVPAMTAIPSRSDWSRACTGSTSGGPDARSGRPDPRRQARSTHGRVRSVVAGRRLREQRRRAGGRQRLDTLDLDHSHVAATSSSTASRINGVARAA